jgi:predicted nuclease of predicted toxin-antitoxin system
MKFKLDENLPLAARDVFSEAGYDALSVHDQAVAGAADEHLAQICRAEERILVTLDLDFADIRLYPPHDFPAVAAPGLSHDPCGVPAPVNAAGTRAD